MRKNARKLIGKECEEFLANRRMAIGEAGSITTNSPTENEPITVTLAEALTDPVFALTATNNGGNQFVLRVIGETLDADGNTTAFTFIIEEWEYHDGPHPATETINWIAVEAGVHTLPDGRVIEAGTTSADNTNSAVTLNGDFDDPPVVLTSVMSENDTTTVDSDPLNITPDGFNVRLQEEEGEDGSHAVETVGWIAIQAGGGANSGTATNHDGVDDDVDVVDLGDTFTNGIVIAETQTINGGDTATVVIDSQTNSTVGIFIEEEQSADSEENHINETVGVVAFEDGLIACFTAGTKVEIEQGTIPIEKLNVGDKVETVDNGHQPILWIGQREYGPEDLKQAHNLHPVRIIAGALGHGLPTRDLLVSRQHRVLVSSKIAERMFGQTEVLIAAHKLTALPGIYEDRDVAAVTYVHVMLPGHEMIRAEGAQAESLYLGDQAMKALTPAARQEVFNIFPELEGLNTHPISARFIPSGKKQAKLMERHAKNAKPPLM